MKVSVISSKGLETNLNVVVDKSEIEKKVDNKLDEVKGEVQLKGFRPGKVPKELIKKQFNQNLQGEVLEKLLQDTTLEVLKNKKIKPASQPKINIKSYGENKNLEFEILVERVPEIKNLNLNNIKVNKYLVASDKKDIDNRLKLLAENSKKYNDKNKNEKAQNTDLVIFDYEATIDNKVFENNKGNDIQIILGKDLFIKDFDKQLIGSKVNQTINVSVNLPQNFPNKNLIGKKAIFKCIIKNIKNAEKQIIDDEFAKNLGVKNLNELKENIQKQISNEFLNVTLQVERKEILDKLEKLESFEIPKTLIKDEIESITHSFKIEKMKKINDKDKIIENINLDENEKKQAEILAKRRVKLALILNKIGSDNNIIVEDSEVQRELDIQLRNYPGQEKNIREFYKKNPNELLKLKGPLFENKIIGFIKKKAKISEKTITKDELKKLFDISDQQSEKQTKTKTTTSKKKSRKK